MSTSKSLLFSAILILTSLFVSCNSSNNGDEPVGAISLNMMNEDNGKTTLGYSDVFIENAHNFLGPSCFIADRGKKHGLDNSRPILDGLATRVAVESGKAYQFFKNAAILRFPSGKLALRISADYYNVYVVSQIKQDDVIVGANVKFTHNNAPHYDLPKYNSNIGTLLRL